MAKNRESDASRRRRRQETRNLMQDVGLPPDGPIRKRIDLDSSEFAHTFIREGGRESVGGDIVVRATDCSGRRVEKDTLLVPKQMGMGRGKRSWEAIAARWKDVEAIQYVKKLIRATRARRLNTRLKAAVKNGDRGFYRQNVSDQEFRSILLGTNQGKNPIEECDGLLAFEKLPSGRYGVHRETFAGARTPPDENGDKHRVGVQKDFLWNDGKAMTFVNRRIGEQALFLAIEEGAELEFESGTKLCYDDIRDGERIGKMASKLKIWHRRGPQGDLQNYKSMYDPRRIDPREDGKPLGTWEEQEQK